MSLGVQLPSELYEKNAAGSKAVHKRKFSEDLRVQPRSCEHKDGVILSRKMLTPEEGIDAVVGSTVLNFSAAYDFPIRCLIVVTKTSITLVMRLIKPFATTVQFLTLLTLP